MAQTSTINVRVDENIKREAEDVLDKLGMNISVLVNMTLRQLIMDQALPFLPKYIPNYDAKARKAFIAAIDDAHRQAVAGELCEGMSLEDINSLISEARMA